jgi:Trichohyalin-plectin-homology domain
MFNTRQQQIRLERSRNEEIKKNQLIQFVKENNAARGSERREQIIEAKRTLLEEKIQMQKNQEIELEKKKQYDEEQRHIENQNIVLAKAAANQAGMEEAKRVEILSIVQSDESLRALQSALGVAYATAGRAEQIAQKNASMLEEKEKNRKLLLENEKLQVEALAAQAEKDAILKAQTQEFRVDIIKQMKEKSDFLSLSAAITKERDRSLVSEIVNRIRAEDEAEEVAKNAKRSALAIEREQAMVSRHARLEAIKVAEKLEEERCREYMIERDKREEAIRKEKMKENAQRDLVHKIIMDEHNALRKRAEEEDALRALLVEAEVEERRMVEEEERKKSIERNLREMHLANEEQKRFVHFYIL